MIRRLNFNFYLFNRHRNQLINIIFDINCTENGINEQFAIFDLQFNLELSPNRKTVFLANRYMYINQFVIYN